MLCNYLEESIRKEEPTLPQYQGTDIDFVYSDTDDYFVEIAVQWFSLSASERKAQISSLAARLQSAESDDDRLETGRAILYILQGNLGECDLEEDQAFRTRCNVYTSLEAGLLSIGVKTLLLEIGYADWAAANESSTNNNGGDKSSSNRQNTGASDMTDSEPVRVLLSLLYILIETIRNDSVKSHSNNSLSNNEHSLRQQFVDELDKLRKSGSLATLRQSRRRRNRSRTSSSSSSEDSVSDESISEEAVVQEDQCPTPSPFDTRRASSSSRPDDDLTLPPPPFNSSDDRVIPWRPKVRQKDIEDFLSNARLKYVFFTVPNDINSLAGLPKPICEAVRTLKDHLYVSLGEAQAKHESLVAMNPISMANDQLPDTATERLYRLVYTQLPQYEIALLRILLSASPTYRSKPELKILAEVMPRVLPTSPVESAILSLEINRHRELIIKAISAILLLLLKHFKFNHIYQCKTRLVDILTNLSTVLLSLVELYDSTTSPHTLYRLPCLEFPARHVGNPFEVTLEQLVGDCGSYSWGNMFTCINLLRLLNMIVKWKHSRIIFLAFYKSVSILKPILHIRHTMLQLYVLKLLKMQSHYCGKQWRKSNMSIISAIYQKVRHRLTDNWVYGNDVDPNTCQFQFEESAIFNNINLFNQRRYTDRWLHPEFRPGNNSIDQLLEKPFELSDEFKTNYEQWLEEEVFSTPINWSNVLSNNF